MVKYTPNFNLGKPEGTDMYSVLSQNTNMDTIDSVLKIIEDNTEIALEKSEVTQTALTAHLNSAASYDEYELNANQSMPSGVVTNLLLVNKINHGPTQVTSVNTTNGEFSVLEDGVYEIHLNLAFAQATDSSYRQMILSGLPSTIRGLNVTLANIPGIFTVMNGSTVCELKANDKFFVSAVQNSGTVSDVYKSQSTRIKIKKVG